jgi:cytochrome c-type biogenesis protein CcmF
VVKSQVGFNLWSRETLLLGNNLVLVVAASMILLGTLYPLVLDALTGAAAVRRPAVLQRVVHRR